MDFWATSPPTPAPAPHQSVPPRDGSITLISVRWRYATAIGGPQPGKGARPGRGKWAGRGLGILEGGQFPVLPFHAFSSCPVSVSVLSPFVTLIPSVPKRGAM